MSGADDGPQPGLAFGHGGVAYGGSEHSGVEQLTGKLESFGRVANVDWNDGGFAALELEAALFQLAFEEFCIGPEFLDQLFAGGRIQQRKRRPACRGGGRGMRSGKQKGPSAQIKKIDQVARPTNVAAHDADGFAQRTDLNVHATVAIEMVHSAAAAAAEHAAGVRVVHHHDAVVFFGQVAQLRQRGDVAIHRKDAVGNDELLAGEAGVFLQDTVAVFYVLVLKHFDGGAGQTRSINDGGMIQFVGDDQVFFTEHSGNRAGIGGESGLKDHAGFDVFELGDLFFQLHVELHGSGNGADGASARAKFLGSLNRGFPERLVGGEAEIVVRGQVDDFSAVENANRLLLALQDAEFGRDTFGAQLLQLFADILQRIVARWHSGLRHGPSLLVTGCLPGSLGGRRARIYSAPLPGCQQMQFRSELLRHAVGIHQDFAGQAALQLGKSIFKLLKIDALAEKRLQIQTARFEQGGHLHPGFIHATAVDALDRRAFENDIVDQVEGNVFGGNAEQGSAATGAQGLKALLDGGGVAAHFEEDIHTGAAGLADDFFRGVFRSGIDDYIGAHFFGHAAAVFVGFGGEHCGAPTSFGHGDGH